MSEINNVGYNWMAVNTFKCNCVTPVHFKGLTERVVHVMTLRCCRFTLGQGPARLPRPDSLGLNDELVAHVVDEHGVVTVHWSDGPATLDSAPPSDQLFCHCWHADVSNQLLLHCAVLTSQSATYERPCGETRTALQDVPVHFTNLC